MYCCCGNINRAVGKIWILGLALGMTMGTSVNLPGPQLQNKGSDKTRSKSQRDKNSKRIRRLNDWLNITVLLRKTREQSWKKYEK